MTTPVPPPKPEGSLASERSGEHFRALVEYAAEAELEAIEAMSPEEVEAELAALGLAPLEERAVARAVPAPQPKSSSRGGGATTLWMAMAALVVCGYGLYRLWPRTVAPPLPDETRVAVTSDPVKPPHVDDRDVAAKLREDARGECGQRAWERCRQSLEKAAALDPAGESAEWTALHTKALEALRTENNK